MRRLHRRRPGVLALFLLATLIFRAYIPVGFMPARGMPFLVELCPSFEGAVAPQHLHHQHAQGHANFQNCPFGSAPAQGPISGHVIFQSTGEAPSFAGMLSEAQQSSHRLLRIQQPRGPPSLA